MTVPTLRRFQGRTAIVTGAAQGIGAAIAERLAAEGATVACVDLDQAGADEQVRKLHHSGAAGAAYRCDVSRRDEVEQTFAAVAQNHGGIDIVISNAGVTRDNLLHRMTDEEWDVVINTHLRGGFLCAQVGQQYMVPNQYGKIILMSSQSALGSRGQANYSAAKAGVQGLTRTLALELGRFGINVNAIAPGHITTPMTRAIAERMGVLYEDVVAAAIEQNALKRVGVPEDVASLAAFLASEEASYITGQIVYITGGPTV